MAKDKNPVTLGLIKIADNVACTASLQQQNPAFDAKADIRFYLNAVTAWQDNPGDKIPYSAEAAPAFLSVVIKDLLKEPGFLDLPADRIEARLRLEADRTYSLLDQEYRAQKISATTIDQLTSDPQGREMLKKRISFEYNQSASLPAVPQVTRDIAEMAKGLSDIGASKIIEVAKQYDTQLSELKIRIWGSGHDNDALGHAIQGLSLEYFESKDGATPIHLWQTKDDYFGGIAAIEGFLKAHKELPLDQLKDLTELRDVSVKIQTEFLDQFESAGEKAMATPEHQHISWSKSTGASR